MNTHKFLVTLFVFALLALVVLGASRVEARQQSLLPLVSRNYANQDYFSPRFESIVDRTGMPKIASQDYFSPRFESIVGQTGTPRAANQVYYSPSVQSFVYQPSKLPADQHYFSPRFESIVDRTGTP